MSYTKQGNVKVKNTGFSLTLSLSIILISANRIEDIFPFRSLNYEVLSGDKKGISSIRVNSQYRIEFTVNKIEDKEPVLTICNILELSNHYK